MLYVWMYIHVETFPERKVSELEIQETYHNKQYPDYSGHFISAARSNSVALRGL